MTVAVAIFITALASLLFLGLGTKFPSENDEIYCKVINLMAIDAGGSFYLRKTPVWQQHNSIVALNKDGYTLIQKVSVYYQSTSLQYLIMYYRMHYW